MRYTVCITLPKDYFTINCITKEDVNFIAAAFEAGHDSFFFSGTKYDIKGITGFQVFSFDIPEDWQAKINASQEVLKAGIFKNGFVFFPPHVLSKLFTNATNEFVQKYSIGNGAANKVHHAYINQVRIDGLRSKANPNFDVRRLVRICEEINDSFSRRNFFSTIFLVRSMLDHVPPIFQKKSFAEVANNHGGKSFKEAMLHLENSSRKIADLYLHTQIKNKESLPEEQQVNFSQAVDLLLAEIIALI